MAKLSNFSASGVISDARQRRSCIYDLEHDFIPLKERPGFTEMVAKMKRILKQAKGWVTGRAIREQLQCTADEWDAILASLVDEIAVRNEYSHRPLYRLEKLRRQKMLNMHEMGDATWEIKKRVGSAWRNGPLLKKPRPDVESVYGNLK